MIILEKDGLKMVVSTELQASAFVKNGYVRVQAEAQKPAEPEQKPVEIEEAPKRRRRKASYNAE